MYVCSFALPRPFYSKDSPTPQHRQPVAPRLDSPFRHRRKRQGRRMVRACRDHNARANFHPGGTGTAQILPCASRSSQISFICRELHPGPWGVRRHHRHLHQISKFAFPYKRSRRPMHSLYRIVAPVIRTYYSQYVYLTLLRVYVPRFMPLV